MATVRQRLSPSHGAPGLDSSPDRPSVHGHRGGSRLFGHVASPHSLGRAAAGTILAACFIAAPALAVDQAQVAGCLGTADLKLRLACYDALVPAPAAPAASVDDRDDYVVVTLPELKANKEKLLGDGVATSGRLYVQGQLAFLREQGIDAAPVPVSITRLSKDEQREVRTRCPSSSACNVFVEGKVVHVSLGIGIAIEDVKFR